MNKADARRGDLAAAFRRSPWPAPARSFPPTCRLMGRTSRSRFRRSSRRRSPTGWKSGLCARDGLPRVDYVLAVRGAGLIADDSQHPGFANMLAGMLNEGTAKRDSRAIAEMAQGLGGSVGAGAGNDGITVSANALASNAGPMLELMAEIAQQPSFPASEVELAKANALQALKAAEATPSFRSERAMSNAIYGDHPYGHTQATVESINSMSRGFAARRACPTLPSRSQPAGDHRAHRRRPGAQACRGSVRRLEGDRRGVAGSAARPRIRAAGTFAARTTR